MEVYLIDDKMVLLGKELVLSEVCDKLANLSASQIVQFFNEINIKLPRILNTYALRQATNLKVKEAKNLNLSDEIMYRLRFYPDFSEYQLQSFYEMVYTPNMDILYKQSLFKLILLNTALLNISDEQVEKLINLEAMPYEEFSKFEDVIMSVFYDFNKDFDGIRKETIVSTMRKSATSQDIRNLGSKYNISIPKRLKRDEMQTLIEEGLRKQHKLTEEMKEKLDKLPIINLQRVAKQNGIKVSVDLKKEDLIAYLLNEVDKAKFDTRPRLKYETDLGDGFVFDLSYVMAVEEIEEFVNEENENTVVPEVKVEEPVVEPVVEETKVEEPVVEEVKVEETMPEEPKAEETVVEETTVETVEEPKVEETKEEVIEETKEVVEETVEEPKVEEPVVEEVKEETVKEEVKPISNLETITKCIVDVIRELAPILTKPKEPLPQPVINIYNNEVKEKEVPVQVVKEDGLAKYNYKNFDNQVSPNYDPKVAATMAMSDANEFKKSLQPQVVVQEKPVEVKTQIQYVPIMPFYMPPYQMPQQQVPVQPTPVVNPVVTPDSENVDPEVVTEEGTVEASEVVTPNEKAKKKKLTQKERNENYKAYRLAKLNKKKGLESPSDELSGNSAELAQGGTQFVIPASVIVPNQSNPSGVVDTVPANIVISTDAALGATPMSQKQEDSQEKQNIKENKKEIKRQQKLEAKQLQENKKLMTQALRTGVPNGVDPQYFDQSMRLLEYKLQRQRGLREQKEATSRTIGTVLKWVFGIIILLLIAYIVLVILYATYILPDTNPLSNLVRGLGDMIRNWWESLNG